jgi:hypothetical protein
MPLARYLASVRLNEAMFYSLVSFCYQPVILTEDLDASGNSLDKVNIRTSSGEGE